MIDADQAALMPDGRVPALDVSAFDNVGVAEPPRWQDYTVGVVLDDRDGICEYVVHACSLGEAVRLAAQVSLADQALDVRALVDLERDGLPHVHILWVRTGVPVHPEDTPGLAWTDLRAPRSLHTGAAER